MLDLEELERLHKAAIFALTVSISLKNMTRGQVIVT